MREHGLVTSAAGLGLHGHGCWTYDHQAELMRAAADYLADGARHRQQLLYVGSGRVHEHVEEMRRLQPILRERAIGAQPLEAFYELGRPTDPERMLQVYAAATDAALADGWTGLRVAAQVTALALHPAHWSAHVRWEGVADRFMARHPLSALCCYDRRTVAPQMLADLCAVHPVVHAPEDLAPFRVYAAGDGVRLDGEVDFFSAPRLERVLPCTEGPIDLEGATFVDQHGARALTESGRPLLGIPETMRRACELMGLPG